MYIKKRKLTGKLAFFSVYRTVGIYERRKLAGNVAPTSHPRRLRERDVRAMLLVMLLLVLLVLLLLTMLDVVERGRRTVFVAHRVLDVRAPVDARPVATLPELE